MIPLASRFYEAVTDDTRRAGNPPELGRIFASSPPAGLPRVGRGPSEKRDRTMEADIVVRAPPLPLLSGGCQGVGSTHGKVYTQQSSVAVGFGRRGGRYERSPG